jgi:hypothetical protein
MLLLTLLRFCGVLLLGMFVLNFFVPRQFRWREELPRLSLLNQNVMVVHAIFIAFLMLLMGLLLLMLPAELLTAQPLARAVLAGLTAFWALRLVIQWFVYDRRLWRGKRFETAIHFAFSGLFALFTFTFAAALWRSINA